MAHARKPFWRPRNVVFMTFGLPLLAILVALGWAVTRPMGQPGKYADAIDALVRERQPATGVNGWSILVEALGARATAEGEYLSARADANQVPPPIWGLYDAWWVELSSKDPDTRSAKTRRADAKGMVEELRRRGVLDQFAALTTATRAVRPKPEGAVIGILLPELGWMRQSARMLGARYALAAEEGNVEEMIAAYEQMLAVARIAKAQFLVIDYLVGNAIESLANERVHEMMMLHRLEGEAGARWARGILAAMDREVPQMARLDHALKGERLSILDSVEWTHTDDGSDGGIMVTTVVDQLAVGGSSVPGLSGVGGAIAGLAFRGKAATVERIEGLMAMVSAASQQPRPTRDIKKLEASSSGSLTWRDRFLQIMLPGVMHAMKSQDQADLVRLGVRTMLALELFRLREGHYPTRLEELVPRDLRSLAEDPIAGGSLRYKLLGNGIADPNPWIDPDQRSKPDSRGYLLYSMGDDGTDNGGLSRPLDRRFEALAGPGEPKARGIDFLINIRPDVPR